MRGGEWQGNLVNLDVDRRPVKASSADDASMTINRAHERRLHICYADIDSRGRRPAAAVADAVDLSRIAQIPRRQQTKSLETSARWPAVCDRMVAPRQLE
jgi:hypothetical protein